MSGAQQAMVDHITIKATDFDGWNFDESPFSGAPTWLRNAIYSGKVKPVGADRDYALWDVETVHGTVRAEPDDRIEWRSADNSLRVLRRSEWYEVKPQQRQEPDGGFRLLVGDYHPGDEA